MQTSTVDKAIQGLYCFLGFDLHSNERSLTLSCKLQEWDVFATCVVSDDDLELKECKLPV